MGVNIKGGMNINGAITIAGNVPPPPAASCDIVTNTSVLAHNAANDTGDGPKPDYDLGEWGGQWPIDLTLGSCTMYTIEALMNNIGTHIEFWVSAATSATLFDIYIFAKSGGALLDSSMGVGIGTAYKLDTAITNGNTYTLVVIGADTTQTGDITVKVDSHY